jgi:transposase
MTSTPGGAAMAKKHLVTLSAEERECLEGMLSKGKASALTLTRVRILLKADQGPHGPACSDDEIASALDCGRRSVERLRQRFVERGLQACLGRKPQDKPSRERKLDGAAEARLIAVACSAPPEGRECWTMQLLADKLVELRVVESISDETVRRTLKKTSSNRGRRNSGASHPARVPSS